VAVLWAFRLALARILGRHRRVVLGRAHRLNLGGNIDLPT